ncbi:hypothetical protein ABIB40_003329 [Pedobacter sp. UYP30]|uniref:glycosyltransferase n=1 Tax=Pedobacter sp. UYP30 TaxID=1756400 RepID=UPI00339A21A2
MKPDNSLIPKIIHHIVGQPAIPIIAKCLHSWQALKKQGFEIRIWNDALIADFLLEQHDFAYSAFTNARNHGEAADIARYLIVYSFGGYYVDWDIELLNIKKFRALCNRYPKGFMLCDPHNQTLASEFFCSIPNDDFLMLLSLDIAYVYAAGKRNSMDTPLFSGPFRMRDSFKLHPNTFMKKIPVKEAFAFDYQEIRNPPKREITQPLIHYWTHSWIKKESNR